MASINFIGGEKGGVGKSVTARALVSPSRPLQQKMFQAALLEPVAHGEAGLK